MIQSFKNEETLRIFNRSRSLKLDLAMQPVAFRKLRMLANAHSINDLRSPPANHLEKLSGDRNGQFSIRINDQYRICFTWQDGNAYDVEIVDYH
jgi:proteic killer suppression protein